MKNINQLENSRKEKIRNLKPNEVDAYIDNIISNGIGLNANNTEDLPAIETFKEKLNEVEELLEDKYNNISLVASEKKLKYMLVQKTILEREKAINHIKSFNISFLLGYSDLFSAFHDLKRTLNIYYTNYNNSRCISGLYIKLCNNNKIPDDDSLHDDFIGDEEFFYNEMLMSDLDFDIRCYVMEILSDIDSLDKIANSFIDEEYLDFAMETVKKDAIEIAKAETDYAKAIKESNYLNLEFERIDEIKLFLKTKNQYLDLKAEILEFLDDDGFKQAKEIRFEVSKKSLKNEDLNKENFMSSEPSYNVRKQEFIK